MPDEHKLRQQAERGQRVAQLLQNKELRGAFEEVRGDLFKAWRESADNERDTREHAWRMTKVVDEIEGKLKKIVRDGDAARRQLAESNERQS